ncbi:MAG: hypothetical protein ACLSB9_21960 [Hydrogeniiclostridium mannosilyticum]
MKRSDYGEHCGRYGSGPTFWSPPWLVLIALQQIYYLDDPLPLFSISSCWV